MKRADYLAEVVRLYLHAPDTPRKARRRDWAIAGTLYRLGVPLRTVAHAIRLATFRRYLRDPELGPLETIHSLAYYRSVIDTLDPLALDPGYVDYIAWKYDVYFSRKAKSAAKNQNTAVSDDR